MATSYLSEFISSSANYSGFFNCQIFAADNSGNFIGISTVDSGVGGTYAQELYTLNLENTIFSKETITGPQGDGNFDGKAPYLLAVSADLSKVLLGLTATLTNPTQGSSYLYLLTRGSSSSISALTIDDSPSVFGAILSMASDSTGTNMYIIFNGDLYYFTGTGTNFLKKAPSTAPSGFNTGSQLTQVVCSADGQTIYCSYFNNGISKLWKFTGGIDTTPTDLSTSFYTYTAGLDIAVNSFTCDSTGTILYLSANSTEFFLYKYNGSWSRSGDITYGLLTVNSIKCDPTGKSIIVNDVQRGKVYYSDDSGNTWQSEVQPAGSSLIPTACPSKFKQYRVITTDVNSSVNLGLYERRSNILLPSSDLLKNLVLPLTKIITSGDGSKVLAINGSYIVYYSNTYGNTFIELAVQIQLTDIAASDDFSVIVGVNNVSGVDTLYSLRILGKNLFSTPVTYATGAAPSSNIFNSIYVSRDGNMIAAVWSSTGVYRMVYSVRGYDSGNFNSTQNILGIYGTVGIASSNLVNGEIKMYVSSSGAIYPYTFRLSLVASTFISFGSFDIRSISCSSDGQYIVFNRYDGGIYYAGNYGTQGIDYKKIIDPFDIYNVSTTAILNTNQVICDSTGQYIMFNATGSSPGTGRVFFVDGVNSANFPSEKQTMKITSNPNPQLIAMSSDGSYQYTFDTITGLYSRNATGITRSLPTILNSSLSTLNKTIKLTSIASDTSGNILGVNYANTDLIIYSSPTFEPTIVGAGVTGVSGYLVSANPTLDKILIAADTDGIDLRVYSVVGGSTFSETLRPVNPTSPGNLSPTAKVTSMALDSTGNKSYLTVNDTTYSGVYLYNQSVLPPAYQQVTNTTGAVSVACDSTGSIVYYITGSTVKKSTNSATSFTDITNNLTNTSLTGVACDSTGSIVYVCDPSNIYKYNSTTTSWTTLTTLITPSPNGLASLVCDPTGTHIMANDIISNFVLISDDGGITWQKDICITGAPPLSISSSNQYRQFISYSDGSISGYNGIYERKSGAFIPGSSSLTQVPPTKIITNGDGSKILIINATSSIKYSSDYGNTFVSLAPTSGTLNVINIAASSDFSVILVQLSDNSVRNVTILSSTYSLATTTNGPSMAAFLAVSQDGKNMVAVTSGSDTYTLYYAMNNSTTFALKTQSLTGGDVATAVTCSNIVSSAAYIYISTQGGKVDTYNYTVSSPTLSTYTFRNSVPAGITSIVCNITGALVYIGITNGTSGASSIYSSSNNGDDGSFNLLTTITTPAGDPDPIISLALDSAGQFLIVQGTSGIYFCDDISTPVLGFRIMGIRAPIGLTQPPRPMTNPRINNVTSNSNGAHQYFFDNLNGLGSRNATGSATPCFLEGTKILCLVSEQEVYLAVETLTSGSVVKTASGFKKIDKIGKSAIKNPGSSSRIMDRLYVCRKDNFPELTEDLYITGYHSILVPDLTQDELDKTIKINGCVFEADNKKCLMAGVCDKTEPWAQEGTFTIWHFSLEDEDRDTKFGVYSNGLLTETCSMNYMEMSNEITFIKSG